MLRRECVYGLLSAQKIEGFYIFVKTSESKCLFLLSYIVEALPAISLRVGTAIDFSLLEISMIDAFSVPTDF